jgi:hypothetical protein
VNRVISGLTLLVFLAAAAPARDADPWESPDLDAEALTAARDAAKELGDKPEAKRRMELLDRLLESLALREAPAGRGQGAGPARRGAGGAQAFA